MDTIALWVSGLREQCNPFSGCCWAGTDSPVTHGEIGAAVAGGDLLPPRERSDGFDRAQHVARIAWFVVNGWDDPIEIDVGIHGIHGGGWTGAWPVGDGNHRLAAAMFRDDESIRANMTGCTGSIREFIDANRECGGACRRPCDECD